MLHIIFSEKEIFKLQNLQSVHPHPVVRRRALIMNLKSNNIPHHTIAKIADVSENTVRNCFEAYRVIPVRQPSLNKSIDDKFIAK